MYVWEGGGGAWKLDEICAALKGFDVIFHVKLRKMMEVGGAEEEDLVSAVKVDSLSLAEGTWTCRHTTEAGQVP